MTRGRKCSPGGKGQQPSAYKRECETYAKKLDVINFLNDNGMPSTLDKFYSHLVPKKRETKRKRIYEWARERAQIERMASSSITASFKSERKKGTATTISASGEEGLVEWVSSLRGEGVPVSRLMLQLQAQDVARDEGVPDGIFEGSWSWQQRFLSRHSLSLRSKTRQGQQPPAAMEQEARAFWEKVEKTKIELGVDKIFNTDQSGICFEYLPKTTIDKIGQKTIWVRCGGKDKERFTGMFLADSTGKQYDPFFVVKTNPSKIPEKRAYNYVAQHGFGDKLWQDMQVAQVDLGGVQIYGNLSAWWNSDLSVAFLDYHFAGRAEAAPILLLWDDFSAHWTEDVMAHAELLNVHLMKVPPGLTSVCQPADISWFRPLKQRLRKKWVMHLSQQLRNYNDSDRSSKFQLAPQSRTDALCWATTAWQELSGTVIVSGFSRPGKQTLTEEPENTIVQQLEQLEAIDETVCDTDVVDQFNDEAAESQ